MNVKEFVKEYNRVKENERMCDGFIAKHIVKKYIPYLDKCSISEDIVRLTTHKSVSKNKEVVCFNSPSRHLLLTIKLVENYTDIEITNTNVIEDYDLLVEHNLPSIILSYIPEYEIEEFNMIFDMYLDDMCRNEYSIEAFASNIIQDANFTFDTLQDAMEEINNDEIRLEVEDNENRS